MANHRSTSPDPQDLDPTTLGGAGARTRVGDVTATGVEVVRSEERLVSGVEQHVRGSVRIGKRVVTEERTVTVTVRREELFVEHLAAGARTGTSAGTSALAGRDLAGGPDVAAPVLTFTLSEEEPVVGVRVVPRESVRVFVDRVTTNESVTAEVAREVVEHDVVRTGDVRDDPTAR